MEDSGKDIFANQVIVLDGCYPDICRSDGARENFTNELRFGGIRIAYATDVQMFPITVIANPELVFRPCEDMAETIQVVQEKVPAVPKITVPEPVPASFSKERISRTPKAAADVLEQLQKLARPANKTQEPAEKEPSLLHVKDVFTAEEQQDVPSQEPEHVPSPGDDTPVCQELDDPIMAASDKPVTGVKTAEKVRKARRPAKKRTSAAA